MTSSPPSVGWKGSTGDAHTHGTITAKDPDGELWWRYDRKNNNETVEVDTLYKVHERPNWPPSLGSVHCVTCIRFPASPTITLITHTYVSIFCRYRDNDVNGLGILLRSTGTIAHTVSAVASSLKADQTAIISVPEEEFFTDNVLYGPYAKRFHDCYGNVPRDDKEELVSLGDCRSLEIKPFNATPTTLEHVAEGETAGEVLLTYNFTRNLEEAPEKYIPRTDQAQDRISSKYITDGNEQHLQITVPVSSSYNENERDPSKKYRCRNFDFVPTKNAFDFFRSATTALFDTRRLGKPVSISVSDLSKDGQSLDRDRFAEILKRVPAEIPKKITDIENCNTIKVYDFKPIPNGREDQSGYKPGRVVFTYDFNSKTENDYDTDWDST